MGLLSQLQVSLNGVDVEGLRSSGSERVLEMVPDWTSVTTSIKFSGDTVGGLVIYLLVRAWSHIPPRCPSNMSQAFSFDSCRMFLPSTLALSRPLDGVNPYDQDIPTMYANGVLVHAWNGTGQADSLTNSQLMARLVEGGSWRDALLRSGLVVRQRGTAPATANVTLCRMQEVRRGGGAEGRVVWILGGSYMRHCSSSDVCWYM